MQVLNSEGAEGVAGEDKGVSSRVNAPTAPDFSLR
jgi:hypothetical protein